jgi:hypothetical protein
MAVGDIVYFVHAIKVLIIGIFVAPSSLKPLHMA